MRAVLFAGVLAALGPAPRAAPVAQQGAVRDIGIFSDLDGAVRVTIPRGVDPTATRLWVDDPHRAVVLYD